MKKRTLVVLGLVLSLSLIAAGSAFARWGGGYGMMGGGYDRGPDNCYRVDVDPESLAKFQKETLALRDELITKRLELTREYDKDSPDADRIAGLRKDIIDVETKIGKIAEKYDLGDGFR
ncbi:MAG: hypothetical protein JSV70_00035, partial [bacterium]